MTVPADSGLLQTVAPVAVCSALVTDEYKLAGEGADNGRAFTLLLGWYVDHAWRSWPVSDS
jgi:hypothetical protein